MATSLTWRRTAAGLTQACSGSFDLIILDVMLPGVDGWTILQTMREKHISTPVLVLTARDAVHDRVKGLGTGRRRLSRQTIRLSELLVARVRSLLRRGKQLTDTIVRIDDLEMDLVRHRANRAGKRMELTPKNSRCSH